MLDPRGRVDDRVAVVTGAAHGLGGGVGVDREVADAVLFLASDEASYITGHTLA